MTDKQNPVLGAKVPVELYQAYQSLAEKQGRTVGALVREALEQYLGLEVSRQTAFEQLQSEVARLGELSRGWASIP